MCKHGVTKEQIFNTFASEFLENDCKNGSCVLVVVGGSSLINYD